LHRRYITLIEMPVLETLTSVGTVEGFDLSPFTRMRDTGSMMFSKALGFNLRTTPYTALSAKIAVQDIDFYRTVSAPQVSRSDHWIG
jgi:hypothetical protein